MTEYVFPIDQYDSKEYIFFPACAYNGNRFQSVKRNYPPFYTKEEMKADMPVIITDVPRLNPDGSGVIEITTGDVSVPCMGMFSKERKKGLLIFTIQQIGGKNLGLSFSGGTFKITYPARRENIYLWPFMRKNTETYDDTADDPQIKIDYRVLDFDCESMEEFYAVFFRNRHIMQMDCQRAENLSYAEQWEIQKEKFNEKNYIPGWGYIDCVYDKNLPGKVISLGWCGTGMVDYAMMKLGGALEWSRGLESLDFIFQTQDASGLIIPPVTDGGKLIGDARSVPGGENWILVRRIADILYFIFKHFELFEERNYPIPEHYKTGAARLADAVLRIWKAYGQLGQYVNYKTGEVVVTGSTSGGMMPAGLVKAYAFFHDDKYLKAAEEIAEQYYTRDAANGYTTGGPGDALQCPDSESAFALLESMVLLYEATRKEKWLQRAEYMTHFFSSWVVPYNYAFPAGCEFARLQIKTTGTVFANVQNKHSAPGICTMSGDSIYKLYQFTKNPAYLELIKDIKTAISQCMSTKERPIFSWTVPKDHTLYPDAKPVEPEQLPSGYICERVNMSDWETEKCIGGVFNHSCFSESTNLLTMADLPEDL